jgi:hypothetical protein
MSQGLRSAALIVGAVAVVATGVGAAAGLAGLTKVAAAASTVAKVATVASAVASAAAYVTAKRPAPVGGGSQTDFAADPRAGVPYAIGRTGRIGILQLKGPD